MAGERGLPRRVEEAIGRRLLALSEPCLEVLRAAAVAGEEAAPAVLADVAGLPEERVAALLEEAAAAGMVVPVGAARAWRFAHGLVRRTLYATLPPERRAVLHRRAGLAMERLDRTRPSELAYHFSRSSPADPRRVAVHAERAGHQAMAALAFEEAARLYRVALAAAVRSGDGERQARLAAAVKDALSRAARGRRAREEGQP